MARLEDPTREATVKKMLPDRLIHGAELEDGHDRRERRSGWADGGTQSSEATAVIKAATGRDGRNTSHKTGSPSTKSEPPAPSPEGHRGRLRERYARAGAEAFAGHELLELLLTFAIPRKDTKAVAKRLLGTFGSLHEVLNAPQERLSMVEGIGPQSALLIRLVRDLHRPSVAQPDLQRTAVTSTKGAVEIFQAEFASASEEQFLALLLDVSSRLLRISRLADGTIDRATVYPRHVAEEAIKVGAAAVIIGHNHPRAAADPTPADHALTRQLYLALTPLGIEILDHVIVGEGPYYSFASRGDLDAMKQSYLEAVRGR
jgi:DNA repair protein RadC